jgi:hypothetical protein
LPPRYTFYSELVYGTAGADYIIVRALIRHQ